MVRQERTDAEQRDAVLALADFAEHGIVGGPERGNWTVNGPANVRIESYRPQRLDLAVVAEQTAVVGTSIPRWPGWKLELNGRPAPLLAYNRAFLGFTVPKGRHRAVLKYRPDGFVAGAAISLATALTCLVLMFATRRRRAPGERSPARASEPPTTRSAAEDPILS
jgi:hypothetical protein